MKMQVRKWAIRLLSLRSTFSRFLHFRIGPLRKLLDRSNSTSSVRLANVDGNDPMKPEPARRRYAISGRRWNWLGIWLVVKSLRERSRVDKYVNRNKANDIPRCSIRNNPLSHSNLQKKVELNRKNCIWIRLWAQVAAFSDRRGREKRKSHVALI